MAKYKKPINYYEEWSPSILKYPEGSKELKEFEEYIAFKESIKRFL